MSDRHPAEVRLECAALVAAHPERFVGALIPAAAELAAFVLDGKVPGEPKPDDTPKMAMGQAAGPFISGLAAQHAAQHAAQGLQAAQAKASERPVLSDAARVTIVAKLASLQLQLGSITLEHTDTLGGVAALGLQRLKIEREIAELRRDLGEPG